MGLSMRIFITGAAGFIGSRLADALIRRGDSVVGFDDFNDFYDPAVKRRNVEELASLDGDFAMIEGDLREPAIVREALGDGADGQHGGPAPSPSCTPTPTCAGW